MQTEHCHYNLPKKKQKQNQFLKCLLCNSGGLSSLTRRHQIRDTHCFPDDVCDGVDLHPNLTVVATIPHVSPHEESCKGCAHDKADEVGSCLDASHSEYTRHNITDCHDDEENGWRACRGKDVLAVVVLRQRLSQLLDLAIQSLQVDLTEGRAAHLARRREQPEHVRLATLVFSTEQLRPDVWLVTAHDLGSMRARFTDTYLSNLCFKF